MLADECRKAVDVKGTSDTAQTILGYDAYFGSYTVDKAKGIVTHHLESALFPGDIGKNITRHFAIAGDVLTIGLDRSVRILKVVGFSERRGDAPAARLLYDDLQGAQE